MIGELPRALEVSGRMYPIRTDYRDMLRILTAFGDPELEEDEKVYICLFILYRDFDAMPQADYEAAFKAAVRFIDHGTEHENADKPPPQVMDWEQDESILFPAINKAAGREVRTARYIHWWTFLGYYMEIGDGVFSTVLHLRTKKAQGKKLEKWEQEYWNAHKELCKLQPKRSAEEQAEIDRLNAMLG